MEFFALMANGIIVLSLLVYGTVTLSASRNLWHMGLWLLVVFAWLGLAKLIEILWQNRKLTRELELNNARREGYEQAKKLYDRNKSPRRRR